MPRQKTVVLLGAGASVDAGLPTSLRLTQIIYDDMRKEQYRNAAHARLLGYVISRLQARNARLGQSPYDPIEVEELFDALNSLANKDALLVSEFVERWDRTLGDFLDDFDGRAIGRNFETLVNRVLVKQQNRSMFSSHDSDYENFARSMQKNSNVSLDFQGVPKFQRPLFESLYKHLTIQPESTEYLDSMVSSDDVTVIASLNYDLAIEASAKSMGLEVDYGLDRWDQQKKVSWRGNSDVKLLKLHGSLNWTGSLEDITIRHDEIKSHESRVMIFGGVSNKLSAEGPFLQFLGKLENALNDAEVIVIIGYSFRDAHINSLLQRRRLNKRKTKMIVIDPKPVALYQIGFRNGAITRESGGRKYNYTLDLQMIEKSAKFGVAEIFG